MMSLFPSLTDSARLWIWVADRPLSESEQSSVAAAIDGFLSGWTSHRRAVLGASSILLDQVLILAAEIPEAEISGCGIDKSVHLLDEVAGAAGFEWSSSLDVPIVVEDTGKLAIVSRSDVRRQGDRGDLSPDVLIIDRTLSNLGELRRRGLKQRARDTWAQRLFRATSTPPR